MPNTPRRAAQSRAGSSKSARPPASRPAAARPAAAARGRRPSAEMRTPRSIKGLAILAAIFVMLAITIIPALRSTLNQQGEINDLRDRLVQQRKTVAALQHEQQQWSDPAYVEQQARERLKFVRVGEKSYTVIDAQGAAELAGGPNIAAPAQASSADAPWYGRLWQSMVIADAFGAPPASNEPSPATPGR